MNDAVCSDTLLASVVFVLSLLPVLVLFFLRGTKQPWFIRSKTSAITYFQDIKDTVVPALQSLLDWWLKFVELLSFVQDNVSAICFVTTILFCGFCAVIGLAPWDPMLDFIKGFFWPA